MYNFTVWRWLVLLLKLNVCFFANYNALIMFSTKRDSLCSIWQEEAAEKTIKVLDLTGLIIREMGYSLTVKTTN